MRSRKQAVLALSLFLRRLLRWRNGAREREKEKEHHAPPCRHCVYARFYIHPQWTEWWHSLRVFLRCLIAEKKHNDGEPNVDEILLHSIKSSQRLHSLLPGKWSGLYCKKNRDLQEETRMKNRVELKFSNRYRRRGEWSRPSSFLSLNFLLRPWSWNEHRWETRDVIHTSLLPSSC